MSKDSINPYTWVGFVVTWSIIIQVASGFIRGLFSLSPLGVQLVLLAIIAALYGAYKIWRW